MADYPNGGTPPQTFSTTSPAAPLPTTGGNADNLAIQGGGILLAGVVLCAVAYAPFKALRLRWHQR